ncbi:hypothetical protein EVA_18623 [gut metagenome]|uniref:Uncharacterized protein n=1 Tax=gut metagenome TaxID=749906 RepID=J9C0C1_9ZZZZ
MPHRNVIYPDKQSASCLVYLQIVGRFLRVCLHHS